MDPWILLKIHGFVFRASSAGVERVFSAAGKMHGDLSKSAKDTTLEHTPSAAPSTRIEAVLWFMLVVVSCALLVGC